MLQPFYFYRYADYLHYIIKKIQYFLCSCLSTCPINSKETIILNQDLEVLDEKEILLDLIKHQEVGKMRGREK